MYVYVYVNVYVYVYVYAHVSNEIKTIPVRYPARTFVIVK